MSESRVDLNIGDLAEVRRRVVEPVLGAMLRPGELVSAELVIDDDWPGLDDASWAFHRWPNNPDAGPPGTEPRMLYLVIRAVGGEQHTVQLGNIAFYLDDASDRAHLLEESLSDWICETSFGWADARSAGDLVLPGPRLDEQGRRTVEIWASEGGSPLTVDRAPTDPADLGLSVHLVDEIREWARCYDRWADEAEAEDQRRWAERMAEPRPAGMSVTFVDAATTAQQTAAVANARELEHLGRWHQLVARVEPERDALLDRIREELGEAFHVPTPPRVL